MEFVFFPAGLASRRDVRRGLGPLPKVCPTFLLFRFLYPADYDDALEAVYEFAVWRVCLNKTISTFFYLIDPLYCYFFALPLHLHGTKLT